MTSQAHPQHGHPFHLVNPSPWPVASAFSVFVTAIGGILGMHKHGWIPFLLGMGALILCSILWFRDIIQESREKTHHTPVVRHGLRLGFAVFIFTELMLFASFFWAFFDASLFPMDAINHVWPPEKIKTMDPFELPYFNTLLLLLSGTSITWAHHALLENNRKELIQGLQVTVLLGFTFLVVQAFEYHHAPFAFKDGIYPSLFFMATGFHGAHVFIGATFLTVCLMRARGGDFTPERHVGFECAAWYWHFVDVVWLFLFISIYWWGS